MAPNSKDDSLMFLYECLKATHAKIDFNDLSTATGLNVGAARMRLNRLKGKLAQSGANIATTGSPNTSRVKKDPRAATSGASATLKRQTPGATHDDEEDQSCVDLTTTEQTSSNTIVKAPRPIAFSTPPQKRKAPSASHDSHEDQNFAKQIDSKRTAGKSSVGKRQTRGKKVNYTALYEDGDEEDDFQSTTLNSDSSDGDFDFHADEPASGGLADLNIDKEEGIKRVVKRTKRASSRIITGPIVKQSSNNRKKPTAAAKKTPLARPRRLAKPTTLASRVPSIRKKAAPKALIPRFDRPLPSIEDSAPLSITSSDNESDSESDIDIKRLQPGTILSFGKGGAGAGSMPLDKVNEQPRMQASRVAPTNVSRFFDPSDTASDASSRSSTGVGSDFQLELKNYAQEISPNDSISMVNERKGQGLGSLTTPSPPMTGRTALERFTAFLPWRSG